MKYMAVEMKTDYKELIDMVMMLNEFFFHAWFGLIYRGTMSQLSSSIFV